MTSSLTAVGLYFKEIFTASDPRMQIIHVLREFFLRRIASYVDRAELERKGCVSIHLPTLLQEIPIGDLSNSIKDNPVNAIHDYDPKFEMTKRIFVRIQEYSPSSRLRDIKSNFVDKFVSLTGNVVRVGNIKPMIISLDFQCSTCGNIQRCDFADGIFTPPTSCLDKCRGRTFLPNRQSASIIDRQVIRVQEIVKSEQLDQGRLPRSIECELTNDLVDTCVPGDIITVAGIVKARKTNIPGRNKSKEALFVLYVEANNIDNKTHSKNGKLDLLHFSERDHEAILRVSQQKNLFKLLVDSLCPNIFGHEVVKASLVLALFGGTSKNLSLDKCAGGTVDNFAVRGDPHILVVGDPGLGKSQMLRAACNLAPRGVYVCGNTTTSTGLTVTMVKEGKDGEYALEAGALVLADQGVCCIDEFDKMTADHNVLLEAMEQQSISIAKAGIVCNLAARTSVLAAANPIGGHYKSGQNCLRKFEDEFTPALAVPSTFDIVFILLDTPDQIRDQRLSEHVLKIHGSNAVTFKSSSPMGASSYPVRDDEFSQKSLHDRLQVSRGEEPNFRENRLPPYLLRKYISYARTWVHPRMSRDAKLLLTEFYLKLRADHQPSDMTPITTRQLESLIRLAQARAKLELREIVEVQDAQDAIDIMKESLYDVFANDRGNVDSSKRTGRMSKSAQIKTFVKAMKSRCLQSGKRIFGFEELRQIANRISLGVEDFSNFVEKLNHQNYLLVNLLLLSFQ